MNSVRFVPRRCQLLDFGTWADGGYAMPAASATLTEEDIDIIEKVRESRETD